MSLTENRPVNLFTRPFFINFDVGAKDAYWDKDNPDWKTEENHKGFDVTANRVIQEINNYVTTTGSIKSEAQKVFWITGHSRGAGIANIIGAYFETQGKQTYVYTFAAPNTTTMPKEIAGSYKTIFNVLNTDDLIPELPLEYWGFRKYGTNKPISVKKNY